MLHRPFLNLDIDLFVRTIPQHYDGNRELGREGILHRRDDDGRLVTEIGDVGRGFLSGFHLALGAFATAGNRLIVSHILLEKSWLDQVAVALHDFQVLYVGLTAPLDVLEAREHARGDRTPGFAQSHRDRVQIHCPPDLVVDTSRSSVDACASDIHRRLLQGPPPSALRSLVEQR